MVYNVSNDFVDHIKAVENQTAIPENADVSVDNSKSTLVRKKSDPTYNKNRGNTCNDPMAVMTENGTCQCFELMEDVGQGKNTIPTASCFISSSCFTILSP